MSAITTYLEYFIYGYYPYLAGTVFLFGSLVRFDYGQYTWKTGSSQMLSTKNMRLASNLFHIGIITIFFGHLVGLLTPHWMYEHFLLPSTKQLLAVVIGGIAGVLCVIGGAMLLYRRMFNPRVRASSSKMDTLILAILLIQACLGLTTIFFTLGHMDGEMMLTLASWAQAIVFFNGGAANYLQDVSWIFKLHIFLGLTIILLFPFTRLVHVWSAPFGYLTRRYQLVRKRG
ncbi:MULTISPECIES: respiratory nitrate reductase subunit gamma [Halomonas]|uniref:nitrate reductase (quinone) n=1 Tax=Halomonas citrativorans TaxID=2742612 RepID=A0A1R4HP24_9GAMM|nr:MULTISPECIES: respiratory nitrate reductase subunit gamma [Halomonas]MBE0403040.1 respiratory nitrate reductase subunit gamma [Halomonas citrativorans]SJN09094.1 Respiratory nitrate reductase gamma chain [Halomonas citrativorans]HCR97831.1 respiratory nitrate reductase subunit gamma [Halomonas sp.]